MRDVYTGIMLGSTLTTGFQIGMSNVNSLRDISAFREFLKQMTLLVSSAEPTELILLERGQHLLANLVKHDNWLPDAWAQPDPRYYQQYLLYCDPLERFSVVSFVWGPGQFTPIHDHTVWGIVGVLRGAEFCESYQRDKTGKLTGGGEYRLSTGKVECVSPSLGDIHRVRNAYDDRVSISIHVYGADIGAVQRHVYVPDTGEVKNFVSGYSSQNLPNLWGNISR